MITYKNYQAFPKTYGAVNLPNGKVTVRNYKRVIAGGMNAMEAEYYKSYANLPTEYQKLFAVAA